ncbi:glycosyltransferase family 39 protein [candidate division WWE3 bacterium]|uniref:Glycosyltransferase family 39 protein n=1 Tax=candidate division WWE3 bacterium TaxID=2053526 RepID=A0A7X9DK99_UNCKA|nr:glycosyltransferase family 39 protein [candidate division WWE3 bacterium]
MRLLKNIQKNSVGIVLALSILSHIFLINFNAAEWGDSYRILRAAQLSRTGFYPIDEKRPPLFSLIIANYPEGMDPLMFGRVVMTVVSILSIVAFYFLAKRFIKSQSYLTLALLLFWLNPVYLYWSLRIYADVLFSLFVMCIVLLFYFYETRLNWRNSFVLGVLSAFSVLLRFEGYLLVGALWAGLLFRNVYQKGLSQFLANFKHFIFSVIGSVCVLVPYMVYKNPFSSSYLSEPSGREYTLTTVLIFVVSLVFSFGFLVAPVSIYLGRSKIKEFILTNYFISFFIFFSLILILLWPAAIPRLFVSVIPYLVIMLILAMQHIEKSKFNNLCFLTISLGSIIVYATAQYFLKLQFLIVIKPVFALIIFINLLLILSVFKKRFVLSYMLTIVSVFVWAVSTLWIHKDIYKSISEASKFVSTQYRGLVVHNDINSVADWYLNYYPGKEHKVSGKYVKIQNESSLSRPILNDMGASIVMITNEHDMSWQPDFSGVPYLEEIKIFRYNVNSGNFFTGVYKIKD